MSAVEIAKRVGVSSTTVYGLTRVRERGFASLIEYQQHLARNKGFATLAEYHLHLIERRGIASQGEYRDLLARKQGFDSFSEYKSHLDRQKEERPANQEIRRLVNTLVDDLGYTQTSLARFLGVSRGSVSRYAQAQSIPRPPVLERLISIARRECPESADSLEAILQDDPS